VVLGPRFLIEAGFIVVVAVVAGLADLSTWAIIGVVAAAWILVAVVELAVWARKAPKRQRGLAPHGPDPGTSPEPLVIRPPQPNHVPKPQPEEPVSPPREWNLWELERVARDNTTDDVAKNEERAYLLMYLREFAGSDGTLPADFDGLVRDAFGDLLHVVAT
jgi:hypothetical protein